MAMHPRYDVRARQRSKDGVKPLDLAVPPTRDEMMIDLLHVRVTGWLAAASADDTAPDLFRRYLLALTSRQHEDHGWGAIPSRSQEYCRSMFRPGDRWLINEAVHDARCERDRVKMSMKISLNPTRILHHRLKDLPEQMAGRELLAMSPEIFFAAAAIEQGDLALGGVDNALPRPVEAQRKLGPTFIDTFLKIFDFQLSRWALDALAPAPAGFDHLRADTRLIAQADGMTLSLNWADLTVTQAEANFERRHSSAQALMERLAHTVPQAHSETGLRRYGETELGGRRLGSAVVGFARTKTVHQVYYAKYRDRVRAETRYLTAVRNAIRATRCQTDHPLAELLGQVRDDAVRRANGRWVTFCEMCAEPRRATLNEMAGMIALIAECVEAAGVAFLPVFSALLTSGGIDETDTGGSAPRGLMVRLEAAGLISRHNLNTRRRPGERRRHALTGDWLEIVQRMKVAFDEADPQTNIA